MSNVISKFAVVPKIPPKRFDIGSIIKKSMTPTACPACKKS